MCQKLRQNDKMGINGKLNECKTKEQIVFFSTNLKTKREGWKRCSEGWFEFLERDRESGFSLDFWWFGPSVLDGARSKVDLRREGYEWTPIWWSSDNSKR